MGYTAGTLELSILGASDSAVASIDKTVKSLNSLSRSVQILEKTDIDKLFSRLSQSASKFSQSAASIDVSGFEKLSVIGTTGKGINSLANAINKLNSTQTVFATQQLSNLFQKLSASIKEIDPTSLKPLSSIGRSVSSISKVGNVLSIEWDKIDWNEISRGFEKLTTSITPFINKVKEAETSLNALYGILNKSSGKKIGNLLNTGTLGGGKSSKSFGSMFKNFFRLSRWTAVFYIGRRIGNVMGDIVTKGSDFGETLNLWKVAMGDEFLPQATEFVNKLNEAYGISKETLMNSQAIFKNMLGSLGQISDQTAYQLSEGITQMALDYASLYNVQFEDAMTKFQAALAGQVRPIRSVSGYDITENTLFQLYQSIGGTKTMRQLSRTEKQLLAIYAVFEQMGRSGATGDLERTINSFANQSRVMADSWKEVQTYAGLTVTRILEQYNVMKYINAILIFMSRILEGLATSLDTGLGNSGDVFGDMENGVNDTTEAVENLQTALLDFDKFRALDQTSTVGEQLGIDQTILDAMTQYDSILEGATLEAGKLADEWLKALGFVDANNDGIIDMAVSIDKIKEKLSLLWESAGKQIALSINETEITNSIYNIGHLLGELVGGIYNLVIDIILNIDWQKFATEWLENTAMFGAGFWDAIFGTTEIKDFFEKFFNTIKLNQFFKNKGVGGFANGGLPDKGTMFVAGEAGAEMVYNMPSGQSGVANISQIAQATYGGTIKALNDWWGGTGAKNDIPQLEGASDTGLYQAVTGVAGKYGKTWAKV